MESKFWKRLFSMCIVIALVLSMCPTIVFAERTVACPCPDCQGKVPAEGWQVWDGQSKPSAGHYYLENTITLAKNAGEISGKKVVIDLNGNDINCGNSTNDSNLYKLLLNSGSVVTLMDSTAYTDAEGNYISGTIKGGISKGSTNASKLGANIRIVGATFYMYGGTVSGGETYSSGGNISISSKSSVYFNGGVVKDGLSGSSGGNVYIAGSTCVIQGTAKILDGESNATGGGNIHVTDGAQLTIDGQAEISGGDASARGGNIYANNATTHVDMFGGTLQNGKTTGTSSGGNAFFYEATFDFYGGTIKDGECVPGKNSYWDGGNIMLFSSHMNMYGGTISGGKTDNSQRKANSVFLRTSDMNIYGGEIQGDTTENNYSVVVSREAANVIKVYNCTLEEEAYNNLKSRIVTCTCVQSVTEEGKTTYKVWQHKADENGLCTDCGHTFKAETICATCETVHTPSNGQHTWEVTAGTINCVESYTLTYTCKSCGATKTETFEPVGTHDYDANGDCTRCDAAVVATVTDNEGNVTYYATLLDAIAAANNKGYTVKVLKSVTEDFTAVYNKSSTAMKNMVIDSNPGVVVKIDTLSSISSSKDVYVNGVTFTENITIKSYSCLNVVGNTVTIDGTASIYILSVSAGLVVNGALSNSGNAMLNGGTMTVNGSWKANTNSNNNFIAVYGGALIINNATVTCDHFKVVGTNSSNADVTLNNATVTASQAVSFRKANLVLEGTNTVTAAGVAMDLDNVSLDTKHAWVTNNASLTEARGYGVDLTLLKDIALSGTLGIGGTVTIDQNGFALTGTINLGESAEVTLVGEKSAELNFTTDVEGKCVWVNEGVYTVAAHNFTYNPENGEGSCSNNCGATTTCEHIYGEYISNKDATCETDGTKSATCSVCKHIDTVTDTGSATAHADATKTDAVAPDCNNAGNSAYWTCPDCGKYFADVDGQIGTEIEENSWILNATAHANATKTDAVAPDCNNAGNSAYWTCPDCGKYFADVDGQIGAEIEENSWILPKTGHTYTYASNHDKKTHTIGCEKGDYTKVEDCVDENGDKLCDLCGQKLIEPKFTVDGVEVETLDEALALANNGSVIKLLDNVVLTERLTLDKELRIDLEGYSITGAFEDAFGMIYVKKGAVITFVDGLIENTADVAIGNYGYVIVATDATVNGVGAGLYNFYYQPDYYGGSRISGEVNAIWNSGELVISEDAVVEYLDNSGYATIYGTVNEIYAQDGSDAPGVYNGNKLIISDVANVGVVEIPEGYKLVEVEPYIYKVVACNYVAEVNGTKYETLEAALAADGEVKLIADIDATASGVIVAAGETIDLNGYKLTADIIGVTIKMNGGTFATSDYLMVGATEGKYTSTDAVFTIAPNATMDMTIVSGTITLNETLWYTMEGQTLTIAEAATFVIPEGKTLYVNGSKVVVNGTAANFGTLILANGAHLKGDVAGTFQMAGGTFETSKYVMIGATEGKYISSDAIFTVAPNATMDMTIVSGTITLNDPDWWTLQNQTLTIAEAAKFVVPAGKNINVQGTVIVNGTAVVDGTVTLYNKTATVKAAEGLNVVTAAGDIVLYEDGTYKVHDHSYSTVVTDPTCTEKGFTTYTCVCGDTYKGNYVDETGHSYVDTYTPATETENAYTTYTCSCGDSYTVTHEGTMTHYAVNEQTGESYADLQAAINAAAKGETVKLLKDTTAGDLYIGAGKKLDLNGKKLFVTEAISASFKTTHIIDSTNGSAALVLAEDVEYAFNPDNAQLPIWTAEGLKFVNVGFDQALTPNYEGNPDKAYYRFALDETQVLLDQILANGTENTGLKIRVKVNYITANGMKAHQYFEYSSDMVKDYYNHATGWQNAAFRLYLKGVETVSNLSFTAEIVSVAPNGTQIVVAAAAIS